MDAVYFTEVIMPAMMEEQARQILKDQKFTGESDAATAKATTRPRFVRQSSSFGSAANESRMGLLAADYQLMR